MDPKRRGTSQPDQTLSKKRCGKRGKGRWNADDKPLNAIATHVEVDDSLKWGLIDSKGRTQQTIFINESGLYALILSSKLEQARVFKRARQVHHGGCQEGETAAVDGQGKGWQHGEHMEEAMLCGTDGRWQFPEERKILT